MTLLRALHDRIIAGCPDVIGVSIGQGIQQRDTWRIDFRDGTSWIVGTKPSRAPEQAVAGVLATLDPATLDSAAILPVTALQARRALRAAGIYATVKAAVDAATDPDVQDSWNYAILWHRDAAWIKTLGAQLKLTPQQIDALFLQASTL